MILKTKYTVVLSAIDNDGGIFQLNPLENNGCPQPCALRQGGHPLGIVTLSPCIPLSLVFITFIYLRHKSSLNDEHLDCISQF